MQLLIVAATPFEIQPLVSTLGMNENINNQTACYQYHSSTITVLITGVGMVATTYSLTKLLSNKRFDAALNLGIAGSFQTHLPKGAVLNITSDCFAELGADDNGSFMPIFDLNLLTPNTHPYTEGWLQNSNSINSAHLMALRTAKGITVNTVHGTQSSIDKTKTIYNPDLESMEGAAFAYVCLSEQIPFAQIRSISNFVEPRNKANWDIPLAIQNLNSTALTIVNDLCEKAR